MADPVRRLAEALAELAGAPVALERPADPAHGDYATSVALRLAPARGRPPRELAAEIAREAAARGLVAEAEAAGPGFVNVRVTDAWLAGALAEVLAAGDAFGGGSAGAREKIQVELVSANPTGPLTVAHGRNGAYGDSVARLLAFAGHEVVREYYYNDAGAQMERFHASVEAVRRGEEPPEDGYRGAYIEELAALPGDPVPAMLERIEATLERFRVHVDTWERQSEIEAEIPETVALLDTYVADGAVWARTSAYGDDKDRVLIRSDGTPTYFGADAAYIRRKLARGFDRLVYVLGADHHGYVARLQALAEMLGRPRETVEVLIYQLVHLVEAGEAKRMSKRRGDVVFLDELLDTIGVDAARWFLVSRSHDQAIELDVDLAKQQTQKNPVYYVQYAHARIAGILRNTRGQVPIVAQRKGPDPGVAPPALAAPLVPEERELVKRLLEFPALAAEAAERRGPHMIPVYAIRVADDFHRFYHHHRVLGSEQEAFRLALCAATAQVVRRCLDLIGVEAPERM
ncbi:MAG TPA: arginine--tRNA ligase [Gaiellaceae bacterium]|nr:arginine--tRNA ligase [Gaiellaceae bacterium]